MASMNRSIPIRLLLIFAMLLSQLGGLTHGIEHRVAEQDQSLPHDKLCDLCASYAQLGSVLGSHAIQFTPIRQVTAFVPTSSTNFHSTAFIVFAARAPPHSA